MCGQFVSFMLTVTWELHHSAVHRAIVNLREGLPAGTRILARCGTYLIRDLTLVRGLGAGPHRVLVSLDYLPIAEGVLPSSPLQFRHEIADQKTFRRCQWCGDANAYGISTVGAEHHCDGRARNFLYGAASKLVRSTRLLGACCR